MTKTIRKKREAEAETSSIPGSKRTQQAKENKNEMGTFNNDKETLLNTTKKYRDVFQMTLKRMGDFPLKEQQQSFNDNSVVQRGWGQTEKRGWGQTEKNCPQTETRPPPKKKTILTMILTKHGSSTP